MRAFGLAILLAINLSGCATTGVGTALKHLQDHPEHCGMAVEAMRQAIATGQVPGNIAPDKLDELLHKAQAGFWIAGLCPAP